MSDLTMGDFAESLEGITESNVFLQLFHPSMINDPEGDALPLFQLGAAIMLDKPLVILIDAKDTIPVRLARAADRIVVVDDLRGPGGMERGQVALQQALKELMP